MHLLRVLLPAAQVVMSPLASGRAAMPGAGGLASPARAAWPRATWQRINGGVIGARARKGARAQRGTRAQPVPASCRSGRGRFGLAPPLQPTQSHVTCLRSPGGAACTRIDPGQLVPHCSFSSSLWPKPSVAEPSRQSHRFRCCLLLLACALVPHGFLAELDGDSPRVRPDGQHRHGECERRGVPRAAAQVHSLARYVARHRSLTGAACVPFCSHAPLPGSRAPGCCVISSRT